MNSNARIRVIIHCRGAGADIFRTLVSLSCQTIDANQLHIVLASTAPAEHTSPEARLLHRALGFGSIEVLDARDLPPAKAVNIAALEGGELWLALVPTGARLAPRFMARSIEAADAEGAVAAFPSHTAGAPDGTPLIRVRPFNPEQLTRANPVGPAAVVRRSAWEVAGGLRPELQLAMWDLWLRLAMENCGIVHVPELLAHCRPQPKLSPWQDTHAKAMLVVSTPGAFEPDVCRWALAALRGEPWAAAFDPGRIPAPRDVRAMHANYVPAPDPAQMHLDLGGSRTA